MSVDRNAMARALIANNMTENDLFLSLDRLRSLVVKVLELHSEELAPELRDALQAHVDDLKPILNATFRPVGILSDPFVPRYAGTRIEYRADGRGFAAMIYDKDGNAIMRNAYACDSRLEIVGDLLWDLPAPEPAVSPLAVENIVNAAKDFVSRLAAMWELPVRAPYVVEASVASELEAVLTGL